MEFYATCPTGFERLLADELARLGTPRVRPLQGQVAFEGELAHAYAACLESHLASRVIAVLARIPAANADELYEGAHDLCWEQHLPGGASFAIQASGTNAQLKNTQFVALRIKDAIADRMLARAGARPPVNPKAPDVRIVARVTKNRATLGIDLAGEPLFSRGYARDRNARGLRADYAAALLMQAGWPHAGANGLSLVDASPLPSTILVEAGLIAAGQAPGLARVRWGFMRWGGHNAEAWNAAVERARERVRTEARPCLLLPPETARQASRLRAMLRASGLDLDVRALDDQASPDGGMVACDLSHLSDADLAQEASALARTLELSRAMGNAPVAIAAGDALPAAYVGVEPQAQVRTRLGQHELLLSTFEPSARKEELPHVHLADGSDIRVLVPASDQFATRLRKVARQRAKWARREDVSCYRVYDTDLPDYAVTLDLFQGTDPTSGLLDNRRWLLVSEYAAPKEVDEGRARSRLVDVLAIAPKVLDVRPQHVFLRVRRKDRGGSQYARTSAPKGSSRRDGRPSGSHLIEEGGLSFEVNFQEGLDCGIFLDHRDTRGMLREMAKQTAGSKRFLNLFAYTGTATCYAADGGMKHTTTVDLSRPYLDWARRNMVRNGFDGPEHEYVQADVVRWVSEQRHTPNRWDLVFCDVPTFSNSSRMGRRSFDVQRDHAELLIGVSRLLTRSGTCVFSCNLRTFKPDVEKLARAGVVIEDITARTIPEDFSRNPRIHKAYLVRRG